jgi:hypothetical protein
VRRAPPPGVGCPPRAHVQRASALAQPWRSRTTTAPGAGADAGRECTNHATLRLTRPAPTMAPSPASRFPIAASACTGHAVCRTRGDGGSSVTHAPPRQGRRRMGRGPGPALMTGPRRHGRHVGERAERTDLSPHGSDRWRDLRGAGRVRERTASPPVLNLPVVPGPRRSVGSATSACLVLALIESSCHTVPHRAFAALTGVLDATVERTVPKKRPETCRKKPL